MKIDNHNRRRSRYFIFIFILEGSEEGRKERETPVCNRNINRSPLVCALTRDWADNLGMCHDQESNQQPFALWDDA